MSPSRPRTSLLIKVNAIKHARKVIKYKKFLGVKRSMETLLIQAIKNPPFKHFKKTTLDTAEEHSTKS